MIDWKETTLDKLGDWSYAKVYFRPLNDARLFGNKYPFVENSDLAKARLYLLRTKKKFSSFGLSKSRLHEAGTLCISAAGTVGYAAILKQPSCISKNVIFFNSFRDKSDVRFVKYCFNILREKIIASSQTTTRGWISSKVFDEVKFPTPPLEIQKKIADILSAYDELIENHQRQIEILEKLRTDLYKEWFINLRFPNYEKHLIKDGIPEGWRALKLKDIATIQKGKKSAGCANPNGEYPFFTASFETQKVTCFSYDSFSLVVSIGGEFHVKIYNGKFEASVHTYILDFENLKYIFLVLKTLELVYLPLLNKTMCNTTIKWLRITEFKDLLIFSPTNEIVQKFNIFCEDIQSKIEKLDAKMRKN